MALLLDVKPQDLASFCEKWKIAQLAVFGSALRKDFGPSRDVDLLVRPKPGVIWSLFEEVDMRDELSRLLGRPIDLVLRGAVERSWNRFRREEILSTAEPLFVSG